MIKDPERMFTSVNTLNRQIRDVEERMILRRHVLKLHAKFVREQFNEKLASPSVLVTAAGLGLGAGSLIFSKPDTPQCDRENLTDTTPPVEEKKSLFTTLWNAWPFIELAFSVMKALNSVPESTPESEAESTYVEDGIVKNTQSDIQ